MKIKEGLMTTEFWLVIATALLDYIVPDAPKQDILVVISYIGSRGLDKLTGSIKAGILSTEFWVAAGTVAVGHLLPGLPPESVWAPISYILARGGLKFWAARPS